MIVIRELHFYTDGAFSSKTELGGWGCLCVEDGVVIDTQHGGEKNTTNNRMELMGFLCALEQINEIVSRHTSVTIYTDSAYIANCMNERWYARWLVNGWRTADKKEVKNQDLWGRIVALYIKNTNRLAQLKVEKVKSHSTNEFNKYADLLAVRGRKELEE